MVKVLHKIIIFLEQSHYGTVMQQKNVNYIPISAIRSTARYGIGYLEQFPVSRADSTS